MRTEAAAALACLFAGPLQGLVVVAPWEPAVAGRCFGEGLASALNWLDAEVGIDGPW